jgi:hypothetical protein
MNKIILSLLFSLPAFGQDMPTIRLSKQIKASNTTVIKVYGAELCNNQQGLSIVHNNKITPCFRLLSTFEKNDAKKIINLLHDSGSYTDGDTTCFKTDHALLILENGVVTGYVNISFFCNKIISSPAIPAASKLLSPKGKDALLRTLKLVSEEPLVAPLEN